MFSQFKTIVATLAIMTASLLAQPRADAQEPETKKPQGKYQVFTWTCSRSIQLTLSTDNLRAVHSEVEKAIKAGVKYRVTTGPVPYSLDILRSPKSFEVFSPQCRGSWRSIGITTSEAEANKLLTLQFANSETAILVATYDPR